MRGLNVYPSSSSPDNLRYVEAICKYAMATGTPVGLDKTTGQFVPMYSNLGQDIYGGALTAKALSIYNRQNHICHVGNNTFLASIELSGTDECYMVAGAYNPLTGIITWGTPFSIPSNNIAGNTSMRCISSGVVLVTYRNSSNYPVAIVGTISGTTVSWGSAYVLKSSECTNVVAALIGSNKVAIAYDVSGTTTTVYLRAATVSGNTLTLGTETSATHASANLKNICICSIAADKFVAVIDSAATSSPVNLCWVCTVSALAITVGTGVAYYTGGPAGTVTYRRMQVISQADNQFTIFFQANQLCTIAATVAATVPTFGTISATGVSPLWVLAVIKISIGIYGVLTSLSTGTMMYSLYSINGNVVTQLSELYTINDGHNVLLALAESDVGLVTLNYLRGLYQYAAAGQEIPYITATICQPETFNCRFVGFLNSFCAAGATGKAVYKGVVETNVTMDLRPLIFGLCNMFQITQLIPKGVAASGYIPIARYITSSKLIVDC